MEGHLGRETVEGISGSTIASNAIIICLLSLAHRKSLALHLA